MKTSRARIFVAVAFCMAAILPLHVVYGQAGATIQCNDCDKGKSQLNGPAHSTLDPRRVIDVKIHNSWGSQTNARIWNSTLGINGPGAIPMWNAVGSPYYFNASQGIADDDAEILIGKKDIWNFKEEGSAQAFVPNTGEPDTNRIIFLPPGAAN